MTSAMLIAMLAGNSEGGGGGVHAVGVVQPLLTLVQRLYSHCHLVEFGFASVLEALLASTAARLSLALGVAFWR